MNRQGYDIWKKAITPIFIERLIKNMKKFLLAACLFTVVQANAQVKKPSDAAMNRFVSDLMKKMTSTKRSASWTFRCRRYRNRPGLQFRHRQKRSKMDRWAVCSILSRSPKSKMYKSGGGAIALKDPPCCSAWMSSTVTKRHPHSPGHELYLDMSLIEQSARIAATEASADGINWTFSPMVDIARDPRWGRIAEGPGRHFTWDLRWLKPWWKDTRATTFPKKIPSWPA